MKRRSLQSAALVLAPYLVVAATVACGAPPADDAPPPTGPESMARALEIADEWLHGYFTQFPEEAYESGYPEAPYDRLGDRSLAALAEWRVREDAWLDELRAIDPAELAGTPAEIPYAFALDRLTASVAMRTCRLELWNVSPTWTGWPDLLASSFAQQPVGSPTARADALDRARDVPRYLDTEVENLREGLRLGYTAPRSNVDAVVAIVGALLAAPVESSPFFEPATRDDDEAFAEELAAIVAGEIRPAIARYRDFLADDYREAAREVVGVSAQPEGEACYRAAIGYYTSLELAPQEIYDTGLEAMSRSEAEIAEIGERSFGVSDPAELLATVRSGPEHTFATAEEILDYAQAAIDRAKAAVPDWFGFVPTGEVVIEPYPDYMQRTGGGFYSAGSADGSRPGTYELGTYEPRKLPIAGLEATTFHETYPGHHLQVAVGLERAGVHPVLRYFFFSGTGEGWALYSERLADEMGLYSGDLDRLGLLSNEALRAARLVVDPGMHALGWTRQEAIDYLLAHTSLAESEVVYEVDRYIAVPAQAVSYMVGSAEIQRLRREAEEKLGEGFDVAAFHDVVIGDGTVTLAMLRRAVLEWVASR